MFLSKKAFQNNISPIYNDYLWELIDIVLNLLEQKKINIEEAKLAISYVIKSDVKNTIDQTAEEILGKQFSNQSLIFNYSSKHLIYD